MQQRTLLLSNGGSRASRPLSRSRVTGRRRQCRCIILLWLRKVPRTDERGWTRKRARRFWWGRLDGWRGGEPGGRFGWGLGWSNRGEWWQRWLASPEHGRSEDEAAHAGRVPRLARELVRRRDDPARAPRRHVRRW